MTTADLAALQLPNGGFASVVTSLRGTIADCNGFTTALVLRTTRHLPADPVMARIRARGLRHLASCASPVMPEAFAFWPDDARPTWGASVPPDVDDTALALTEMVRYGWLDRVSALRRFCRAILPQRVRNVEQVPPWVVPDAFHTWIGTGATQSAGRNPVDCCVNANVIALMALIGATHLPGYFQGSESIRSAIGWAGRNAARLRAITPFYPSVTSLVEALEHAVECGADSVAGSLCELQALDVERPHQPAACCSSAYGAMVWHCPAVDAARQLARAAGAPPRQHRLICAAS